MLSIVVPVFNEEESLPHFYEALTNEVKQLDLKYELIFVDDGSTDGSLEILKELSKNDPSIRIYSFRSNQGKAEALTLGFQKSDGDLVITLDADLQDQPSELPKFLEKHKEGIEVVCGWRKDRKDKSKMVIISHLFNFVAGKMFGLYLHDYNCGFKLYTKDAAKSLNLYGGLHRFIPLLLYQEGFSVDEIPVKHIARKYGHSKYGFSKIFKDLPDIFTMLFLVRYSSRPLHFFGLIGGLMVLLGAVIFVYLAILHFLGEAIGRRPLLIFDMLLILGGLQVFLTGFIAELLINISNRRSRHFPIKYATEK
jgi:glycosyltransferase involved in cell wall biosynthesis